MIRRLMQWTLALCVMALFAGLAQFVYLAYRINHTGSRDQAIAADVVVVLGAQVDARGQAGPDLSSRTLHGVALLQQGLAPYLVCTGGFEGDRLSAAAVACRLAVAQGIPADNVFLAEGSMTTRDDALSTVKLMQENGWQSAILVSHPLHLERARFLFEAQGVTVYPSPTSTNLAAIPWRDRAWLTTREAVGIVWIGLAELGVPYEWTDGISRWVYNLPRLPDAN
jgi:uncharacterized SAM-binding protein YcdF (DUF218 family)